MTKQEQEILAIRYTHLAKMLKENSFAFKDKEQLILIRSAMDCILFDPQDKRTPQTVEQAFSMLKTLAMTKKMDHSLASELITALQRLVSQSGVYIAETKGTSRELTKLTGFDRIRSEGGHII